MDFVFGGQVKGGDELEEKEVSEVNIILFRSTHRLRISLHPRDRKSMLMRSKS